MTPERWRRIKEVFAAALEVEAERRAALVAELAGGDAWLAAEVLSLLAAHDSAGPSRPAAFATRAAPDADAADFTGNARFEIEARLGAGGFGVVYRARDRERERSVALKVLRGRDAAGLVRFKREFRALADVLDPHLVRLHELFAQDDQVFFTMELVEGRPIDLALREPAPPSPARLARVFRQLVAGVGTLHAHGLLHRDLKPSNVLVTGDDRVVILDFGLATDVRAADAAEGLGGTPAYMAPEQLAAGTSSPASDVYALGVTLYEALAGRLPFEGAPRALAAMKAAGPPPLPAACGAPPALERLCAALLAPDPRARPGLDEVERTLAALDEGPTPRPGARPRAAAPFVGRAAHLQRLRAAWGRAREGAPAVVCLRGASGMGKTALVRRFLDELPDAAVLTSRCHEREALGYKALDGIVDGLSQLWRALPRAEAESLRPEGMDDLARLFPALRSFARRAPEDAAPGDGTEPLRRAFEALRELIARLAARRPMVVFIDDLQWGDDDSAALLRHLLRPADRAPVLVLAACRADGEATPTLANLLDALAAAGPVDELRVDALAPQESRALAEELLGPTHRDVDAVAKEAAGVPFFVDTLVEELRDEGGASTPARDAPAPDAQGGHELRLRTVLLTRMGRLPPPALRLLEVVALAGKPLRRRVAQRAAAVDRADEDDAEQLLRARRLVRLGADGASLETFHDRIRDTVTAALEAPRVPALHGRLARALTDDGVADPEDLAHHLAGAGERDAAARFAVEAAERRARALAFGRAAELLRTALELRGPDHAETGVVTRRMADALAAAGRGGAAGEAYLEAAARLPDERASLTCRGAEQFLRVGALARGRELMARLLRGLGWRLPRTAFGTVLAVIGRRAQLALRGLRLPARTSSWSPGPRSPENLLRIDAAWTLASSAMMVDAVRATYFATHNLRLALDEAEPFRLARALGLEAIHASAPGSRSPARADRLLALLHRLTRGAPHALMQGMLPLAECVVASNRGQWRLVRERSERAARLFQSHGAGVAWEIATSHYFFLGALVSMGEFREYSRRFPAILEDARSRGDVYAEAVLVLSAGSYIVPLKEDRIAAARAEIDAALAQLPGPGWGLPRLWGLFAKVDIALYAGEAEEAWRLMGEAWPRVSRSLLLFVQTIRVYVRHQRGRAALAVAARAADGRARAAFARVAEKEARALEREGLPWAMAFALPLRAGVARLAGRDDEAAALLARAARALSAVDMGMHAAGARLAHAWLIGDAAARAEAEAWMRDQDVVRPERVAALVSPPFAPL
jgi:predicted Ser/Thr protein kinase